MSLSADDRRFFAEHGWLVLRALVPVQEVRALLAAVDAVVPRSWVAGTGGRVIELPGASQASKAIAAHVRDARYAKLVAEALDVPRVQLLQDTLFIKAPAVGGRVEWHQDATYLAYLQPMRAATMRVALTPETRESGCLRVLDGSHRWGHATPLQALEAGSVEDALDGLPAELRARVAETEVEIELQPGDATLHHCLTFHGSGENRSANARKTIAVRAFDADCRVLRDRIPAHAAAHFPVDERGGLSFDRFPLLYDASQP